MMIRGMIIGPAFYDLVQNTTLELAPIIKDIEIIIVLFIGGLEISIVLSVYNENIEKVYNL